MPVYSLGIPHPSFTPTQKMAKKKQKQLSSLHQIRPRVRRRHHGRVVDNSLKIIPQKLVTGQVSESDERQPVLLEGPIFVARASNRRTPRIDL